MNFLTNFAERLKELMDEKDLSVNDISEKINLDDSTIYKYLNCKKFPSVETAIKLAETFQCSVEYLLGRTDNGNERKLKKRPPFTKQLKFLLEHFEKTKYALYTYGKVRQFAVQNWAKGIYEPNLDSVIKMADYFECTVDFVLGIEN